MNVANGYIKLFRAIKDWEWYADANTMRLFIHCLVSANHKPKKWQGIDIDAGSFVTGRLKLAQDLKLSEREIRTALKHLKTTGEVTIKTTSRYSIITVNNWNEYQQNDQLLDQQVTNKRPTSDQQVTTNKNDKNERMKEYNSSSSIEEINLTEEEEELLKSFSKRVKRKIDSYTLWRKKVLESGDYLGIIREEKINQTKKQEAEQKKKLEESKQDVEISAEEEQKAREIIEQSMKKHGIKRKSGGVNVTTQQSMAAPA